jgi:Flp pilus assembly pilin Flp
VIVLTTNVLPVAVDTLRGDGGQGLAEYSLLMALMVVVSVAALTLLGSDISSALSSVGLAV